MTTASIQPAAAADAAATEDASPLPAAQSEGSFIGRFVAIFTPVFAVAAGWFAGVIAQLIPGVHLDPTQIVAFMTAAAASALTAGWKWLQGWQQHEALVAHGKRVPVKPGPVPAVPPVAPPAAATQPALTPATASMAAADAA